MTSKRLGRVLIALAAVWSLAGLDWLAPTPSRTDSVFSVQRAYAGDPDEVATSSTNTGGAGSGQGGVDNPTTDPAAQSRDTAKDESLLEQIIQAIVSIFGDR